MKSYRQDSWHRNPHLKHATRVCAGCDVGCIAQKKQRGHLWTEHSFVACLSSKDASNLGDRVAACNRRSIDLQENHTWEMRTGRNPHVATRNNMCLHDWNQSGQLHVMRDGVIAIRYELPVEPSIRITCWGPVLIMQNAWVEDQEYLPGSTCTVIILFGNERKGGNTERRSCLIWIRNEIWKI